MSYTRDEGKTTQDERIEAIRSIILDEASDSSNDLVTLLMSFSLMDICQLAEKDLIVKQFFESNSVLNTTWSGYLHTLKYPAKPIIANQPGIKNISILDTLCGVVYFNKYSHLNNSASLQNRLFLNKACEYRLFQALSERININLQALASDDASHADRFEWLIDAILKDVDTLKQCFWAVGYFKAADTMFRLASIYADLGNSESVPCALKYLDKAWEELYIADNISEFSIAKMLMSSISPSYCFYPINGSLDDYTDMSALKQYYRQAMPDMVKHFYNDEHLIALNETALLKVKEIELYHQEHIVKIN